MSEQKFAISNHPVVTRPPQLSDGDLLPHAVRRFENHCQNYFFNAKEGVVADDKKVARILSCFNNHLVNDWIAVDQDRLITLTFEQFMTEFRTRWLPHNWESDMLSQVLSARFDRSKISFGTWANQVRSLNVSLRGTPSHLDESRMRRHLEDNFDKELRSLVRGAEANQITDLHFWVAKVKELDDYRHDREKRMRKFFDEMVHARKGQLDRVSRQNPNTKRRVKLLSA